MNRTLIALALAAVLPAGRTGAVEYHLDASKGSDAADGKTPATAWKTIAKVNQSSFAPGDSILLKGGQLHAGTVTVRTSGLTITSFGGGRAVIDAGAGSGIEADGVTGLNVADLEIRGLGRKTGNNGGAGVSLRECKDAVIERCELHGFQFAGIRTRGCSNLRIENVHAHDNGHAGIHVNGSKVVIRRCRATNNPGDPRVTDNHSGNGILVTGSDILVELCEAAGNGWDQFKGTQHNGPVGIWCHDAERVTFRRNIAHHNKSTAGDGGGFDFDGGTRDSVMEFNYSYENQGPGYLVWEYGSEHPIARNVIRYNVSVNDRECGVHIGKSGGQDITGLTVEHNTVINARGPAVKIAGEWKDGKFNPDGGLDQVVLRDNIFIGPKEGDTVKGPGGAAFKGNLYWSFGEDGRSSGLNDRTGVTADPKLADMRLIPQLVDPERLGDLTPFVPGEGSPAAGRGFDPGRMK